MKISSFAIVLFGLILSPFALIQAQTVKADDIVGVWLTQDKDSHVEIFKQGDQYFGKIIWLSEPIDSVTGKPKVDDKNPDAKLQSRPIMGLELLTNFKYFPDDQEWEDGHIYDPKKGATYKCYMEFPDPGNKNKLKIRGYIGFSLLGRTVYWYRVTQ